MLPDTDESGLNERSTHDLRPLRVQPNAPIRSSSASSVAMTIVVFMASLALVRYLMPKLVEEVHYSIERGRQRAQFEASGDILSKDPLNQLSSSSQLVAQRIAPSVVHIDTRRETLSGAEQTQQSNDSREIRGQGSGVIVSSAGHILTNFHVVQGAEEIIVTLSDDREITAEVIGTDPSTDLALLSTNTTGLTPVEWGDSDALQEGAMVWAVGSPFGLSKTITFGILSAKERRSYEGGKVQEFLQSDAAVSAGNSGGPLVDSRGLLVGINTAIIGPTYQGVSFSIPANSARQIYQRMVSSGPRIRGWLGVRLDDAVPKGALITGLVHARSPAKKAGIIPGDIITRWDGKSVATPQELTELVAGSQIDIEVTLEVLRKGNRKKLTVAVGPRPLQFQ